MEAPDVTRRIHLMFEAFLIGAGIGAIVQAALPGTVGVVVTVVSIVVYWVTK